MRKRDYRPYCFDPCNEPLKTRLQQLIEAVKDKSEVEVKVKVDEELLNKAVAEAIKDNPVKVEVDLDDSKIATTLEKDFCKVHAHITCAENNIIETLSCNCDDCGCGCHDNDCGCGHKDCNCKKNECNCGKNECNCSSNAITKEDLIEAVSRVNEHTDRALDSLEIPEVEEVKAVVTVINSKVDSLAEEVAEVKEDVQTVIEKVEETEAKVDDFRALYESFHD